MDPSKQDVFMELYTPHHAGFLRYCRGLTGSREDAADLAGEAILVVFENLEKLRRPDHFRAYLFGVARRLRLHEFRRLRFRGVFDEILAGMIKDPGSSPEMEYDVNLMFELLDRLPSKQREAFILFELSGFSIEEIRQMQGGTLSGVKMRLKRGREQLRQWLEPSLERSKAPDKGAGMEENR
ncbi:MAG: RNA polymerase sigma factor [Bacteroidales bacterium]